MAKITEKQLIESLQQLKGIKPRKEWAVLLKSQILEEKKTEVVSQPATFAGFSNIFAQRKFAYSLATILILMAGVFGFMKLLPTEKLSQQPAALTKQTTTEVIKSQISTTAKNLAQNLENNPAQNSQAMKTLAKTLADMPGDVKSSPDVENLIGTVVKQEITDLQKTILTDNQQKILAQAQDLYNQGKYTEALEEILLINNLINR